MTITNMSALTVESKIEADTAGMSLGALEDGPFDQSRIPFATPATGTLCLQAAPSASIALETNKAFSTEKMAADSAGEAPEA